MKWVQPEIFEKWHTEHQKSTKKATKEKSPVDNLFALLSFTAFTGVYFYQNRYSDDMSVREVLADYISLFLLFALLIFFSVMACILFSVAFHFFVKLTGLTPADDEELYTINLHLDSIVIERGAGQARVWPGREALLEVAVAARRPGVGGVGGR